jgi:hypothetical protein
MAQALFMLDEDGKPLTPLYNYLKPYPRRTEQASFMPTMAAMKGSALETASPVLGNLKFGLAACIGLKYEQPEVLKR